MTMNDRDCPVCSERVHESSVLLLQRLGDDTYAYKDDGEVSLVDRKTLVLHLEEYREQGGMR